MKRLCVAIPARLESTRLHNKILLDLAGKPVVLRTYERAEEFVKLTMESGMDMDCHIVLIVDSEEVMERLRSIRSDLNIMVQPDAKSGTDRVVKALSSWHYDAVLIWQADWPLIKPIHVLNLVQESITHWGDRCDTIWTMAIDVRATSEIALNPNLVKVVVSLQNKAVYFSRCAVPYGTKSFHIHSGIYLTDNIARLRNINSINQNYGAESEDLEQLRYMAHNTNIVCFCHPDGIYAGIDTSADYEYYNDIYYKLESSHLYD